jgi:hypothetical protein
VLDHFLAILAPGQSIWKRLTLLLISKTDLGSSHSIHGKHRGRAEEPSLDLLKLHFKVSICTENDKIGLSQVLTLKTLLRG